MDDVLADLHRPRCGRVLERDGRRRCATDLVDRIATGPRRIARRPARHPVASTAGPPRTPAVKPLRIVDELRLVLGAAARVRRRARAEDRDAG